MTEKNNNSVKGANESEWKDRLVAINRVTKVTKVVEPLRLQLSLS